MTSDAAPHTPQTFAKWLKEQLRLRGYPDRGGQRKLAADSGVSSATVSRIFRADGLPDLRTLNALAEVLHVPYGEIVVRAGVLSQDDLDAAARPITPSTITPEQAAAELGITSPEGIASFTRMVDGLRAVEQQERRASG